MKLFGTSSTPTNCVVMYIFKLQSFSFLFQCSNLAYNDDILGNSTITLNVHKLHYSSCYLFIFCKTSSFTTKSFLHCYNFGIVFITPVLLLRSTYSHKASLINCQLQIEAGSISDTPQITMFYSRSIWGTSDYEGSFLTTAKPVVALIRYATTHIFSTSHSVPVVVFIFKADLLSLFN